MILTTLELWRLALKESSWKNKPYLSKILKPVDINFLLKVRKFF